ncbi:MAG: toxin co-regulated pilus biosynthesis Q family protein [Alphaproteobacteria bacterium]|nr:toxin co-regulated pilus biosynthesis Q family protein [Alphaproteobacteria bacterium]
MFRNLFIFALFATCVGYAFAQPLPHVWEPDAVQCGYDPSGHFTGCGGEPIAAAPAIYQFQPGELPQIQFQSHGDQFPTWPLPGSDVDMQFGDASSSPSDNIRIVSNIGADLVVENNINMGARGIDPNVFSGGANLVHVSPAPAGFNIFEGQARMPLMHAEMLEDDGGAVLAMSRSGRIARQQQIARNGVFIENNIDRGAVMGGGAMFGGHEFAVEEPCEDELEPVNGDDQIRSWVVASGQTLREVLQDWANKEGWDLVWATSREYPVQASAVFKGRFMDVSSALVRNFSRANPTPYAKFYKGNRVIVVSTASGE